MLILLPCGLVLFGLVLWYERRKKTAAAAAAGTPAGVTSFGAVGSSPGGSGGASSVLVQAGTAAQAVSVVGSVVSSVTGLFGALFGSAGAGTKPADLSNLFGLSGKAAATATGNQTAPSNTAMLADGTTLTWNGSEYVQSDNPFAVAGSDAVGADNLGSDGATSFTGGSDFTGGDSFGVLQSTNGGWSDPGPISGGDGSANPPADSGGGNWSLDF